MPGWGSSKQRTRLGHALAGTSIAAGLGGGPIAGPIIGALANWGASQLGPSKAEQRRRFAAQAVLADPYLNQIRERVRAIDVGGDRAAAEDRALAVLPVLSADERAALAAAIEGTSHSGQLQRQLGRFLFAPEFGGGPLKWQGKKLPFGAKSEKLNAARVLELLGGPPASASSAPTYTAQSSAPAYQPVQARPDEGIDLQLFGGQQVPYFNSFLSGGGGGGLGDMGGSGNLWGGIASGLGQLGAAAITAFAPRPKVQYASMPGGSFVPQIIGGAAMGGLGAMLGNGFDVTPGFSIGPQGGDALTSPFISSGAGSRAQAHVQVNPTSGRLTWFGPLGKPVLFSGDFRACKRVARVARKAKRRVGGR